MRYSPELIQKVREAHDILTLFETKTNTPVQKAGINYKALCPFHSEKTPSCHITPSAGWYHCFGCGEKGDVFSLIMHTDSLTFTEAVEYLAETAEPPIDLPKDEKHSGGTITNRRLKEITKATWDFYQANYRNLPKGHPAKQQIILRNLDPNQPHYGYAPAGNALTSYLTKTYTAEELTLAGVCSQNDKGALYDFWRNRLMFTITDMHGAPVSFTGRALDPDETRKYVNGRATPIFEKEKVLYNPNITAATRLTREHQNCYLVEGQFDVISLYDHGYRNVYATSGTAITPKHIQTLQRLTGETGAIIYILDSDNAGQKAAATAWYTAPEIQAQSWAVPLPEGNDPCDYLKTHGTEQFTHHINTHIIPLTISALNTYATKFPPTQLQTQNAFLTEAAKMYKTATTPAVQKLIIDYTAQLTQLTTPQVQRTLTNTQTRNRPTTRQEQEHVGENRTTITHQWATVEDEYTYNATRQLLANGDKKYLAAKKLLHLALYYAQSHLLVQPHVWEQLPPVIHHLYNEASMLHQQNKTWHPDNFTNPPLADLLITPTQADNTPLTPEQAEREFNTTQRILTRLNRRKTRY